ncbi:CopG family transcriptional regulator [Chelatococcus sambhunathii]|uniref:CopG family transcriptional regulator n=1 Tax=Chelatococcus sambhunathii TaxID=363953 RepID=A0ABU1DD05_9HYPH|nr:CopG family transcriptional regulator [Chelatococcus sambhunathii]MDR4305979.1 CopG family transcriptional regulator [Chelatococcus sambhunathii]
MRTTLTIDDDVLAAAKDLAEREDRSVGAVVSDLMRKALAPAPTNAMRMGRRLLPISNPGAVVTLEIVNRLRDEEL